MKKSKKRMPGMIRERKWAALLGMILCPFFTIVLTESYTHDPFSDMGFFPWALNLILYMLLAGLFFMVFGSLRPALRLETALFMLIGLANYYVIAFRSSPILPWDVFSFGTAASVADNFDYSLPGKTCLTLAGFVLLLLLEQLFPYTRKEGKYRLAGGGILIFLLLAFTCFLHRESSVSAMRLYDKLFTPDTMQYKNGCAVAFVMELKYLIVEKPEGYKAAEAAALLEGYEEESGGGTAGKKAPNIIVIMDEAFADMGDIGEFSCNRDYMPFLHSLEAGAGAGHAVTGRLYVSVLGGNTANTEFEFLTGNTMAFFPQGSIPYQQYIRGEIPSLASWLRENGYAAVSMHPYYPSGWSRDKVYPLLGFEKIRFIEDYEEPVYVRKYVSDGSDFEQIIREYEKRDKDRPLFLFNVTMQNHGGYDQSFENFSADIRADGIESRALSNYLSLVALTDGELEKLISYFEKEKEDTLLVFFGDHQPNDTVALPIWQKNGSSPRREQDRYRVPYLLWANYRLEMEPEEEMSVNYLGLLALKAAGIPYNSYYRFLEELRREYPVISAGLVRTADGRTLSNEEWEREEPILDYKRAQYYQVFDAYREK